MLHHNRNADMSQLPNGHNKTNQNPNVSNSNSGSALDALPKQFVASMKTLFDILDDQRSGFVKFSDIEKGWQDDGCKGLPHGVIDSLRKVTPTSGLLSFDRFCAGLKLCLLRNHNASNNTMPNSQLKLNKSPMKPPRPPSTPLLNTTWNTNPNTVPLRTHNITNTHRALSMPQLSPDSELEGEITSPGVGVYRSPSPPPKPPRSIVNGAPTGCGLLSAAAGAPNAPGVNTPLDKGEIRHALQNWQMGMLLNEMDANGKRNAPYLYDHFQYRGCADGGSSSATDSVNGVTVGDLHGKKTNSKRREPRRHTLQDGIDFNMLKRLKQFEEEREVLLIGLEAVEKARDWYMQQLANVKDKIQYAGRMGHLNQWSEVQQERLNLQRARVYEVNRILATLADSWERGGFPLHFNLAIHAPSKVNNQRNGNANSNGIGLLQPVDRLRQQNHHLSNEVNMKSDRIAMLEREKQSLIRELYELQQRTSHTGRGATFHSVLSQSSPSSSGGLGEADVVY